MQWTQQQLHQNNAVLNNCAVALRGKDVAYYVHYWGGEVRLFTNHVHKHSFFEVCYIADGVGSYAEGDREIALAPGVLFVSRPHILHQIRSEGGLYILFFAFELLENESSPEAVGRFRRLAKNAEYWRELEKDHPILKLWDAMLAAAQKPCPFPEDQVAPLSLALITAVEAALNGAPSAAAGRPVQPDASTFVHRAKLYIRDNLAQPLKLSDVANYLHISPRHLSRLFTVELGQTFSHYVRKERVRQAAALLTTTDWSIKRIAEATGFDTVHYFTHVFKKETGLPPGEFSRKFRGQQDLFRTPEGYLPEP